MLVCICNASAVRLSILRKGEMVIWLVTLTISLSLYLYIFLSRSSSFTHNCNYVYDSIIVVFNVQLLGSQPCSPILTVSEQNLHVFYHYVISMFYSVYICCFFLSLFYNTASDVSLHELHDLMPCDVEVLLRALICCQLTVLVLTKTNRK